jgi:hypothetical protein
MDINKEIEKIYYNPKEGYIGANKLYKKLKKTIPEIKLKDVVNFLSKQDTNQLNRPEKKPKVYNSIISPDPGNNYQLDILVYDRYAYKNYKYILVCIDVYSRYVQCRPMTTRAMDTIITNFKDIMDTMGWPKNINCDNEFNKTVFNQLTNNHNVRVWYSEPDEINKNAIVERFNRTIAEKIQLWRTATNNYNWPNILPDLVENYNNTVSRTTKNTPYNLFYNDGFNFQKYKKVKHKFIVGDKVRIKIKENIFKKNDLIKYSKNIYSISKISGNKIYISDDDEEYGPYKPYQLRLSNEIQYKKEDNNDENKEEEKTHIETQKERKIKRSINKEGLNNSNDQIIEGKRIRKPRYQDFFIKND